MGKSKAPSPPPAPDPAVTIRQQALAQPSYYGPGKSLVYSGDPSAGTFKLTESLSPAEQAKYEKQQQLAMSFLGAGENRLPALSGEFQWNGAQDPTTNAVYNAGMELLTPTWDRQRRTLEQSLANKGIPMGSDAYRQELTDYEKNRSASERQLASSSIAQGFSQALAGRQQNYAELAALLSGAGGQPATLNNAPNPLDPVAAQQLFQQGQNTNYQGQVAGYNANQQQQQQAAEAAATIAMMAIMFSDRRLKRDIQRIGATAKGIPLYLFRYVWDNELRIGVLADEVQPIIPEAVEEGPNGFLMVDYAKVG